MLNIILTIKPSAPHIVRGVNMGILREKVNSDIVLTAAKEVPLELQNIALLLYRIACTMASVLRPNMMSM